MMVGSAAYAEMMTHTADLSPSAVVPPTESSASGSADITVDTEAMTISWTTEVDGLTGDPTAAHVHGPAAEGENAAPMIDMSGNLMEGSAEITEEQWTALQDGMTYVNVHTAEYPDGEIRGQVEAAQ
jgi:hypothetical protein